MAGPLLRCAEAFLAEDLCAAKAIRHSPFAIREGLTNRTALEPDAFFHSALNRFEGGAFGLGIGAALAMGPGSQHAAPTGPKIAIDVDPRPARKHGAHDPGADLFCAQRQRQNIVRAEMNGSLKIGQTNIGADENDRKKGIGRFGLAAQGGNHIQAIGVEARDDDIIPTAPRNDSRGGIPKGVEC